MKNLFLLIFLPCLLISQNKKTLFVGAEIGNNTVLSQHLNNKNSFQGGLLAEYYFAKQWSVVGRIKYFKTGTTNNSETGYFEGSVISLPINIKWEYRILEKFRGNLFTGFALNQELTSNYYYPPNEKTDYSKFFGTFNIGLGFSYFISTKTAIYTNYESYLFGNNRSSGDKMFFIPNSANNNIFNIGIKYKFKK
jgi:hypothetical protein